MCALKLFLLGSPRIECDGAPAIVKRRRGLALLAYLAVVGQPQRRDALAELLWPENAQDAARQALRRDLSELNLALGGQWLEADRETVGLRSGFWLDVDQFQRCLDACAADPAACLPHLTEAVALYRDDFLAGFTLSDSPAFDEWQSFQTETLQQACAAALERLAQLLGDQGDPEAAISHARRRLSLDPLHEPAHRQLMQLYAQANQPAAALRQYERCREILHDELSIPPAPETTLLYDQIRERKARSVPTVATPRHNLPTQTTPFIGREQELADIRRLLLDEPDCRLLNLFGPGGIGKTRLALAAAMQSLDAFPDGVYLASLASVGEAAYIVPAIAEALHFTFYGQSDPKDQLLDYLSQKRLLLVIDNFEHLLAGADLLSAIVRHAPGVTLLATSRERLHLQEEWVCEVQGLPFPAVIDAASEVLDTYDAVRLFLQRARQTRAGFAPSADEMADIVRICQLVEGMPLGLELAAPWIRTLSCGEIAAEIARSLDFLTTALRNVLERHRSLRAVFEQTWTRLSQAEQPVLMYLSVFRGGCTREAAEAVAGATLPVLSSLVDKALLHRTNLGRYELHELIRQFAEMQLRTDPQATEQAQQRHQDYFITFLETRTAGVKGHRQKETLAEIKADMDNVRLVWRRAMANRDADAIERSAECLFIYYLYTNGYDEGKSEFGQAVHAFAGIERAPSGHDWPQDLAISDQRENLIGYLLAGQGYFLAHRFDLPAGQRLLEQALALLGRTEPGDRRAEAFTLLWLGWALYFQGRTTEGKSYAWDSLTLFGETGDRWGEGWSLLLLGDCLRDGCPAEAELVYRRGLTLCRESGDRNVLSYLLLNMAAVTKELGYYTQAQECSDEAVSISEEFGNFLGLGYALFNRGQLEVAQGKYPQAIQTLLQSTNYFTRIGTVHLSRARAYLGVAHQLNGDHGRAAELYTQSLEGFKTSNSKLGLARCLNGLGCLARDQGNLHQAEQLHRESLSIVQETEQGPGMVADATRHLGHLMVASGEHRHAEARQHFRQALELAIEHQLAPIALDVYVGVARFLAQAGKTEQAVEFLSLAAQHEASTFETRKNARQLLAELVDQLPPESVRAAQARGRPSELWAAAQMWLAELAEDCA